jgi:hypothetical protein
MCGRSNLPEDKLELSVETIGRDGVEGNWTGNEEDRIEENGGGETGTIGVCIGRNKGSGVEKKGGGGDVNNGHSPSKQKISTTSKYSPILAFNPPPKNILFVDDVDASK